MGKRDKGSKQVSTGGDNPPMQSPFAALGALRNQLPPGEDAPAAEAPAAPVPSSKSPVLGKVVVRRERAGRKGKTVTRVSGIGEAQAPEWARRMKKELGCGGAVEGADVVLSGDLVERAARWLEAAGAARVVRGN